MDASTVISIVALLISLSSFYLSFRAYHRDNSDLRVCVEYWPQPDGESRFNVRAINYGRRIALVERILIHFKKGDPLEDSIAGGKTVTEAQPFDYQLPIYNMNGTPHHIPIEIKSAEVIDTLGRHYTFPRRSLRDWLAFRQLKSHIRKLWAEEQKSYSNDGFPNSKMA